MLVALEGIDGAGKTTAARRLAATVPGAELLDRWSLPIDEASYLGRQMGLLRQAIWPPDLGSRDVDEFGRHYWVFLQAAWYSVLERMLAAGDEDRVVIADGWWFRLVAKLARGEEERRWMESLFGAVREPALTLLLDIDPRLAWGRRKEFKSFELGLWAGHAGQPFDSFCSFQGRIRRNLLRQARRRGWTVLVQDEKTMPDELFGTLHERISELAGDCRGMAAPATKGETC